MNIGTVIQQSRGNAKFSQERGQYFMEIQTGYVIALLDELDRLRSLLAQEMDIEALGNVSSGEVVE